MLQRKIIYIINPVSGTGRHKNLRQQVEAKMKENNIPFFIFTSVADGNYSFLHPVITNEHITDVVIAGGDGTVNQVVGSLLASPVHFGIIPTGSGNGLAYAAGIPGNIPGAINIILQNRPAPTDAFTLNGHFACMLCGLGFDAKIAHDFARKSRRGFFTYFRLALQHYFSARPFPFSVQTEKFYFETEAYFLSIANGNQFGNHFTIAPQAHLDDGLLDVILVTKQNRAGMAWQILKQLAGKIPLQKEIIDPHRKIIYFQTDHLSICNPLAAPLHIDGEPAATDTKIQIRVKPRCFKLLRA